MPASPQDAIRYASDSGFPLQIALQHAVEAGASRTGWQVRYIEHGWVHPEGGASGFIDLALDSRLGSCILVVECKRQRDATWVFMHHSGTAKDRRRAKAWVTHSIWDNVQTHSWMETPLDPACPEATFCAVRGQSSSDRATLLERLGSELVLATEALAHSERDFHKSQTVTTRTYFPVLVTTARLKVADFDPKSVSLEDGELVNASVRDVPYVRVRKQLATRFVKLREHQADRPEDPSHSMESTIFVVHASAFLDFLSAFDPPSPSVA
jgi:hypothetical protein